MDRDVRKTKCEGWRNDAEQVSEVLTDPYTIPCEKDLFRVHVQSATYGVAGPIVLTEGFRPLSRVRCREETIVAVVCPRLDVGGTSVRGPAGELDELGRRRGAESDGYNRLFGMAICRGVWNHVLSRDLAE